MEPWNLKTLEPWNFGTMKPWNLKFLGLYTTNDHHAKLSSLFWQLPVCIIQAHLLAVRDLCTTAQMFKFGSFYQSSHHVTCSPQGLFPCVERLLDKKREPWHFLLADVNASQPPWNPNEYLIKMQLVLVWFGAAKMQVVLFYLVIVDLLLKFRIW